MMEIFFFVLVLVGGLFAIVFGLFWVGAQLLALRYAPRNRRIRKRIEELKASGFAPTHQYVGWGTGVAVDGQGRRIFLANDKAMKLYSIDDVTRVETGFEPEKKLASVIRITVRDLQSPFFEIKGTDHPKLREIDSLLSVMREPSQASSAQVPGGSK